MMKIPVEEVPVERYFNLRGSLYIRLAPPKNDDEFTREGGGVVPTALNSRGRYSPLPFGTEVEYPNE